MEDLKPWVKNPRKISGDHVREVARSIRRFGFVAPIVVWRDGDRMVAGHARLRALALIRSVDKNFVPKGAPGPGLVPVCFHEFENEREANLYALADNKLTELGSWDEHLLSLELGPLMLEFNNAASVAGFDDTYIEKLLRKTGDAHIDGLTEAAADDSARIKESFSVIIECDDESSQLELIDRFLAEGFKCRALI